MDQIEDTLDALHANNVLAFESKMDILMEEHCHDMVATMRSNTIGHHGHLRGNVYDPVFRGELLKFAMAIIHGGDLGDDQYVVTVNGGILHRSAEGLGETVQCPVIQELTRI